MKFDTDKLDFIGQTVRSEVESGRLPGAAFAAGVGEEVILQDAIGYAENHHGVVRLVEVDTLFDLASLTKVVATLPSILSLVDDGVIHLSQPLVEFFPDFATGDPRKEHVTVFHLLTHASGLPAHRPYYRTCQAPSDVVSAVLNEPLEAEPGSRVTYSDLGFMLLGELVRVVTGQRIDEYVRRRIFSPIGMCQTTYLPDASWHDRIAATEVQDGRGPKVGIVHDENAEAMGGISGHAGLFSRLSDVVRYIQAWLDPSCDVLSQSVRLSAVRCQTRGLNGARGLGWVCRGDTFDHMGDLWPTTAVGHTGFTGTSVAFDPISRLWFILLTNDVHYGRDRRITKRLRPRLHNLVVAAIRDVPWR
ncbi:serine hydrolase domain-containing protein [Alicyclobacillus macrosporangiidus]|uniref:serine hydrolase domain-containing protein n=1 Tax=Alicyclobacillus macrosporangiidus TaxID=392015 RepID=UPI00055297F8|nr:serine hydrolase domain-containing protein [Alicyclobacillus macrosporangiidus]